MLQYEIVMTSGFRFVTIYLSNQPDNYPIFNPKYRIEVNKFGEMSFTMGASHPQINNVFEMKTFVCVIEKYTDREGNTSSFCPFAGRVLTIEEDDFENKSITCEGALGIINDIYSEKDFFLLLYTSGYTNGGDISAGDSLTCAFRVMRDHVHTSNGSFYSDYYPFLDNYFAFLTPEYVNGRTLNGVNLTGKIEGLEDYGVDDGSILITGYSSSHSAYSEMQSYCNAYDAIYSYVLKKCGGIILPVYVPIRNNSGTITKFALLLCYKSYTFSSVDGNWSFLFPYPREGSQGFDYSRYGWLPHFDKGYNILSSRKESSLKSKYSGILPIGRNSSGDFVLHDPNAIDSEYLWSTEMVNKYGAHIPIIVKFENATSMSELRSMGNTWLNLHSRDASVPYKYTITGPEPCQLGYGDQPIMLMRDVIIRNDPSELLENSLTLPCLSMEIDIQNPQNNTYVIGPYIDDMYTETTISSDR